MNPKCKCSTPAEICAYCATRDWMADHIAYLTKQNDELAERLLALAADDG